MRYSTVFLLVVFLLAGCGGGGKGGGSRPIDGGGGSPVTSNQIRTQFANRGASADRLHMTELQVSYGRGGTSVGNDCFDVAQCEPATDEFGLIFTPANLSAIPRNATIQDRGSRQGVPLVEYAGTSSTILHLEV